MSAVVSIEDRISGQYGGLSAKLRTAADYVAAHPVEFATRSLRSVAQSSGVSPATFSRLARVLGFSDYEAMREAGRQAVGEKLLPFSERAGTLRKSSRGLTAAEFLHAQSAACSSNIAYLDQNISGERLEAAVEALHKAPNVLLIGSKGSAGVVDYFGYQAQWFSSNWQVAGRNGVTTAAALSRMGEGDVVLVLSKSPYARRSVAAVREAQRHGLTTVVLTDSHTSPALRFADHFFVVPTESPNFFSSYAATIVLIETLVSMLLTKGGEDAQNRIQETEDYVNQLEENWAD